MRKLLLMFLSVFVWTSCSDELPYMQQNSDNKNGRALLAYLVANNNLDNELMENVKWMYQGIIQRKDSCTLLVYYKGRPNNEIFVSPKIVRFDYDGKLVNGHQPLVGNKLNISDIIKQADVVKEYETDQMAVHPAEMSRILTDMVRATNKTRYGLVFGSHATSWLPARNATRSFGEDGGYQINLSEMADALKQVFTSKSLDYIVWDACMMGTAEVCYAMKDVTHYMVASVMESSIYGIPYQELMDELFDNEVDYTSFCKKYIQYYRQKKLWGTIAAYDCSKIQRLADVVKKSMPELDARIRAIGISAIQQYGNERKDPENNFKNFAFDVEDVFRQTHDGAVPEKIKQVLDELIVAKDCLDGVEHSYGNVVISKDRFCGMGMYLPNAIDRPDWNRYYSTAIEWYAAAGWNLK